MTFKEALKEAKTESVFERLIGRKLSFFSNDKEELAYLNVWQEQRLLLANTWGTFDDREQVLFDWTKEAYLNTL